MISKKFYSYHGLDSYAGTHGLVIVHVKELGYGKGLIAILSKPLEFNLFQRAELAGLAGSSL
jgi:hypothetical protein